MKERLIDTPFGQEEVRFKFQSEAKRAIDRRQKGNCGLCGEHLRPHQRERHHIIPESIAERMGLPASFYDSSANGVLLDPTCHKLLDKQAFDYFRQIVREK